MADTRDHREGAAASEPVVRDHRDEPAGAEPVVRDHRDQAPASEPVVRDHRDQAPPSEPVVRDHRDESTPIWNPNVDDRVETPPTSPTPTGPTVPIDPGMGDGGVSTAEAAEDIWAGGPRPGEDLDDYEDRMEDWLEDEEERREREEERREEEEERREEMEEDGYREPTPEPTPDPVVPEVVPLTPEPRPGFVWAGDHWERERAPAATVRDHRDGADGQAGDLVAAGGVSAALADVTGVDLLGGTADALEGVEQFGEGVLDTADELVSGALEDARDAIGDLFGS